MEITGTSGTMTYTSDEGIVVNLKIEQATIIVLDIHPETKAQQAARIFDPLIRELQDEP